jgi:hypothetical protein
MFRKFVKRIQCSVQSDQNNGYFTWGPMCCMAISGWILLSMRNISDKLVEKIKTHFMFYNSALTPPTPENRAVYEIMSKNVVESSWNVMADGDAREGKWRGNWRMEWVASILHTTSELGVSRITTVDVHTSAARNRLNWRPPFPPGHLKGLILFAERRNLVSSRVPSHFNWPLQPNKVQTTI